MTLPIVLIETFSRCNCRCVMCDIWKTAETREFTREQLEKQLPALERLGSRWVVFTGGEPLMHSNIFSLSEPLRERGIRVTLLSTGLLFERYATRIAQSFDDAIVSLDGPREVHDRIRGVLGAFDRLDRGLRALPSDFAVTARCVVQNLNHDRLVETAVTAGALGLRSISFLAADLISTAFNRVPGTTPEGVALRAEQLPALDEQLRQLAADPFVSDSPRHLERIAHHYRAHLGLVSASSPRCNAPWVSAVIGVDGAVRPCFFQPGYSPAGALDSVLTAPSSLAWRAGLKVESDDTCRNCVCSLYLEQSS